VIDESTNAVLTSTVAAGYNANGIAVDAATSTAYVADWGANPDSAPGNMLVVPLNAQGIPAPIGVLGLVGLAAAAAVGLAVIQRRSRHTSRSSQGIRLAR
jgi:hypothetical protein